MPLVADLYALKTAIRAGERLFGLDLGTKTIGIAMSDVMLTIASPLETIQRTKFKVDADRLLQLTAQHGVGGLVIGLPLNMDGSAGPRVQSTHAFVRALQPLTPLPIALWDERLTSAAAERAMLAADLTRKRRAELIDKLAASYILQGALDRLNFTPLE